MSNSRAFEGFEIKYARFRMGLRMYSLIFAFLTLIYFLLVTVSAVRDFNKRDLSGLMVFTYYKSSIAVSIGLNKMPAGFDYDGKHYVRTADEVVYDPFFQQYIAVFHSVIWKPMIFWLWIFFLYPLAIRFFTKSAKEIKDDKHVRGGKLVSAKEIRRKVKNGDLPFGNVRMPRDAETTHTFIMGRPGTGKTVLLSSILERVRERGEKAVIYDPKGDYTRKFYNPERGDVIFNPFDERSCNWNLFDEIKKPTDFEAIGYSLIAKNEGDKDPFWTDGAREIFRCILKYLYKTGQRDYKSLWTLVTMDSVNLAKIFKSSSEYATALQVLADPKQRQAGSLMSTLINYVTAIEYMTVRTGGVDFTLENWLENGKGFIFVTSKKEVADALKPVLTLFIDLLAARFLSMDDNDPKRRIHFFLDEFGTLKRMHSILQLLTLSRSYGGCVYIGIQDVGQIDSIYTKELRQAIVNAAATQVVFALSDPDAAEFAARKIGKREVIESRDVNSMGVLDNRDGLSINQQKLTQDLIMPAEIIGLQPLKAYLRFPGYDTCMIKLKPKNYQEVAASFILRDDLDISKDKPVSTVSLPLTDEEDEMLKDEPEKDSTEREFGRSDDYENEL